MRLRLKLFSVAKVEKREKTADRFKTKIKKKRTKANLYLAFVRFVIKEAGIFIGFSPDISPVTTFLLENYLLHAYMSIMIHLLDDIDTFLRC